MLQGSDVVASLVVFEDGLPRRSDYRRFHVRGLAGAGDVAAVREVVTRRFRRYLEERENATDLEWAGATGSVEPTLDAGGTAAAAPALPARLDPGTGRPRKFAYAPGLLVVDGGAPQVAAAQAALDDLGIDDVALCGLAKRLEEVWLPGRPDPVVLPRTSEGLYLLQRVRDEAHRFAVTFHRQSRSRSMLQSTLDGVPGLGEHRQKALLRHFGSLKRLRAAGADEIAEVPGIGPRTAEAVVAALAAAQAAPAVNTATGEVVEDLPRR
jgi:excinuclease ABC subunit C